MAQTIQPSTVKVFGSEIAVVDAGRPWQWLAAGWKDMKDARWTSLIWGALFAVVGLAILYVLHSNRLYNLMLPLASGFMLVAPVLAVGIYFVSREIEQGHNTGLGTPLKAWRHNPGQVALLGFVLGLVFLFWMRLATLIFAVFFGGSSPESFNTAAPDFWTFVESFIFSSANLGFLAVGTAFGAILAIIVFAIAAVSAPMIMDRNVGAMQAIFTSIAVVRANPKPMALWAVLIVLFVGAGLLIGFIGLAVTLPLIAHATWHAYRDLLPVSGDLEEGFGS